MTPTSLDERRRWVLSVLQRFEARLTRFTARLLGDGDAARDVVQHAFLRLCEQSPDDLRDRVAQWLFTVCRNKAVDLLRARGRTEPLGEDEDTACVGNEPDPAAVVERDELYRRLNRLIDALPPGQREAVGLWSEGFTYRQIAEIVGCREGNVRVLVHRAMKHLRQHPIARQLVHTPMETGLPSRRESTKLA